MLKIFHIFRSFRILAGRPGEQVDRGHDVINDEAVNNNDDDNDDDDGDSD